MLSLENMILSKLSPRFITNEEGEKEEIVFNLRKFEEFWEELEGLLVDEGYELEEDLRIAPVVLKRVRRYNEGQSGGYTQEEVEKMVGVSK